MPWYIYALGAALVWGVHYNLLSKAMTTISPITAYWMPTVIMTLGLPLLWGTLKADFKAVLQADTLTQVSVCIIAFTSFMASVLLYKAIQSHNPVHAGLMEITYPFFIALFALVLFQENHFNWGTMTGGVLMMIGAGVVIYSNS